jgi:IPT/TIG domain
MDSKVRVRAVAIISVSFIVLVLSLILFSAVAYAVSSPTVTGITPASGASTGPVGLTIKGTGFASGVTVKLTQGSTVLNGSVWKVSSTQINCNVDINGKPFGRYDVTVKNRDGGEVVVTGGFMVTNICGMGAGASISVFAGLLGLLSVAGLGWSLRHRRN